MEYIKIIHLLSLMIWVGSLFTLSSLLSLKKEIREDSFWEIVPSYRKIYLFVGVPSLIMLVLSGSFLLYFTDLGKKLGWFHLKLTAFTGLVILNLVIGRSLKKLVLGAKGPSKTFFRFFSLGIVFLVFVGLFAIYVLHKKSLNG